VREGDVREEEEEERGRRGEGEEEESEKRRRGTRSNRRVIMRLARPTYSNVSRGGLGSK